MSLMMDWTEVNATFGGSVGWCEIIASHKRLCPSHVARFDATRTAAFNVAEIEALMQIILPIILNSRATTSFETIELLEPLICLLIDTEQSPYASSNPFVAICKDYR
jgi:hypothetical protein